jgi:imidazolonepropionase-like amidohydrolase
MLLDSVAIVGATVVPMDSPRVLQDHTVVIEGERIAEVGPSARVPVPKGARRIDGRGLFVVPGLVDTHIHIPPEGSDDKSASAEFRLFLANGVTTARVMIGQAEHLSLRDRIAAGALVGPTLYVASPPLGIKAGALPGVPEIKTPADARQFALDASKAGYDGVKLLDGMSLAEYEAFVAGAREAGLPVWGHVPDPVGLPKALELRQDSIEHLAGYVEALIPDDSPIKKQEVVRIADALAAANETRLAGLIAATKAAGSVNVPTLDFWAVLVNAATPEALRARPGLEYVPAKQVDEWSEQQRKARERNPRDPEVVARFHALRARIVAAMHAAGLPVLLGTDSPDVWNVAGVSAHVELKLLAAAGLSPRDALFAATRGPAEFLKGEKAFGSIAPGLRADLLLLEADPLVDVSNLARRRAVVARGKVYEKKELDGWLAEIAAEAKAAR